MDLQISDRGRQIARLLTIALVVYLLPAAVRFLPEEAALGAMLAALLLVNPLLNLALGAFYAWRYGPWLLFPVFVAAVFLPAVFIVYNDSALIYGVMYLIAGFVGLGIGALIRRSQPRES